MLSHSSSSSVQPLLLLCAAVACYIVVSMGAPTPVKPCIYKLDDGDVYDLSSLATQTGTFINITDESEFNINFCGLALGDGPKGICSQQNAVICFRFPWAPEWNAIAVLGADREPQLSEVPTDGEAGIQLLYSDGFYGENLAQVSVQVLCSKGPVTYAAEFVSNYVWQVTINSPAGCPLPSPSPPVPAIKCDHTFPDGSQFDLTALQTSKGTDVRLTDGSLYSINVCGVASGDDDYNCKVNNASLCFKPATSGGSVSAWSPLASINDQYASDQPHWTLIDPSNPYLGVQWIFSNDDVGKGVPLVYFMFYCDKDVIEAKYSVAPYPASTWIVKILSQAGCPTKVSKTNSTTKVILQEN